MTPDTSDFDLADDYDERECQCSRLFPCEAQSEEDTCTCCQACFQGANKQCAQILYVGDSEVPQ